MTASDIFENSRRVNLRGPDKVARYIDCRTSYQGPWKGEYSDHHTFHPDDIKSAKLFARAKQTELGANAVIKLTWTKN